MHKCITERKLLLLPRYVKCGFQEGRINRMNHSLSVSLPELLCTGHNTCLSRQRLIDFYGLVDSIQILLVQDADAFDYPALVEGTTLVRFDL